jgi:hypothetical protein
MKGRISFSRVYHNGLSVTKCPYNEQIIIKGKSCTRFVGECEGCASLIKYNPLSKYVLCEKKTKE